MTNARTNVRKEGAGRAAVALAVLAASLVAAPSPAGETDDEQRYSVEASLRRRDLEKRLRAAAKELAAIRDEKRAVESTRLEGRSWALATQEDVAEATNFQVGKERELAALDAREKAKLDEMDRIGEEFEALRAEVTERYGGTPPPWWRDRLSCPECPG
jgi:hypothetical protein